MLFERKSKKKDPEGTLYFYSEKSRTEAEYNKKIFNSQNICYNKKNRLFSLREKKEVGKVFTVPMFL